MTTAPDFTAFTAAMRKAGWTVKPRIAQHPLFHKPVKPQTERGYWYDPSGKWKYGNLWGGTWSDTYTWRWYAVNGEMPDISAWAPF